MIRNEFSGERQLKWVQSVDTIREQQLQQAEPAKLLVYNYVKCFFSIRMVSKLNKKLFNICCKKQTLQMNLQATIVKPEARPTAVHHIRKQHPWANSELEVDVICRGHAALSYCWQSGGPGCSTRRHRHNLRLSFNSSPDPQYKYMIISQSYSIASAMNWNNFISL